MNSLPRLNYFLQFGHVAFNFVNICCRRGELSVRPYKTSLEVEVLDRML